MTTPRCHCGKKGLYAGGECYNHAQATAARARRADAKARRPPPLCGARIHAMTPENTVVRKGGARRCRACAAAARMRYQREHAEAKRFAPPPAPPAHVPKPLRYTAAFPQGAYAVAMAEAKAEYRDWLEAQAEEDEAAMLLAEVA